MNRTTNKHAECGALRDHLLPMALGLLVLVVAAVLCLSGCTGASASSEAGQSDTEALKAASEATATTTTTSAATSAAYVAATASMDLEYSNRDQDASYDAATATTIALSGTSATVEGAGATASGSVVTISEEGTYVVSGTLANGQLVVETADTAKVQVVLAGVSIHNETGPAIYVKQTDKCFITLAEGTQNTLTDGGAYTLDEGSDEPYATLFSKEDLTLNGTGSLNVTGSYCHAICSKDDLVITGGTYTVQSVEDALRGRDCVKILDGTFTLDAGQDAVKSNNDEDGTRGFVLIDGGTFAISAGDDAVHAETVCAINGGTVDIATCYEGYEGEKVFVNGGETHLVATDDGINASAAGTGADAEALATGGVPMTGMMEGGMGMGSENCLIEVNGGYTVVDAAGDGIDSNGSFAQTGGVLLVCGPVSGDNGAFDYDLSAEISGGTLVMVGSMTMAQNLTGGTQPFAYLTANGQAGQSVAVTDASGTVLASFTPPKAYGMVLVSAPGMTEGGSYTLTLGGTVAGANADGYAEGGTVSGGSSTALAASTTATGGMGGLGQNGMGMGAGMRGDPGAMPEAGTMPEGGAMPSGGMGVGGQPGMQ